MWIVKDHNLQMAEGDYGIGLPVTISGTTFTSNDSLRFTFKMNKMNATILEKEYTSITDNTVQLEFTEEESSKFHVGSYCYSLDWYQDGNFMCNIITEAKLRVVDKV